MTFGEQRYIIYTEVFCIQKGRSILKKNIVLIALGISLLAGCSSKTGPVAAHVSGNKITQSQVKFYIDNLKAELIGDDTTQAAIDRAVEDFLVLEIADKKDIELSDEEEDKVKNTVISFRRSRGGMKSYNQYLKDTGLDEDFIEDVITAMVLKDKLKEESTAEISDDEKKQYFKDNYYRAKHVLLSTENADDAKKEEIKAKAEEIMKRAQSGESFDALVSEFSEDPGSATNPDGYFFTAGEMVAPFENAVKEAEIGGITICESDFGYHVILRLALDDNQELFDKEYGNVADMLNDKIADGKFSQQIMEMAENDGIKVKKNEAKISQVKEDLASATPYPMPESASPQY